MQGPGPGGMVAQPAFTAVRQDSGNDWGRKKGRSAPARMSGVAGGQRARAGIGVHETTPPPSTGRSRLSPAALRTGAADLAPSCGDLRRHAVPCRGMPLSVPAHAPSARAVPAVESPPPACMGPTHSGVYPGRAWRAATPGHESVQGAGLPVWRGRAGLLSEVIDAGVRVVPIRRLPPLSSYYSFPLLLRSYN